jgi:hypothetical protein
MKITEEKYPTIYCALEVLWHDNDVPKDDQLPELEASAKELEEIEKALSELTEPELDDFIIGDVDTQKEIAGRSLSLGLAKYVFDDYWNNNIG